MVKYTWNTQSVARPLDFWVIQWIGEHFSLLRFTGEFPYWGNVEYYRNWCRFSFKKTVYMDEICSVLPALSVNWYIYFIYIFSGLTFIRWTVEACYWAKSRDWFVVCTWFHLMWLLHIILCSCVKSSFQRALKMSSKCCLLMDKVYITVGLSLLVVIEQNMVRDDYLCLFGSSVLCTCS